MTTLEPTTLEPTTEELTMLRDRDPTGHRKLVVLLAFCLAAMAALVVTPTPAEARGGIGVTVYGGYGGYYGHPSYYYRPRYHYYPPPYYYYPPPPPPPPPVVYVPVPVPAPQPAPTAAPPPVPTASQANCREYETTMIIDSRPQRVTGTACLQPDGSWRIIR